MKLSNHISWIKNDKNWEKHVDIRYFVCRKAVPNDEIKQTYFPTTETVADILAQSFVLQKFTILEELFAVWQFSHKKNI